MKDSNQEKLEEVTIAIVDLSEQIEIALDNLKKLVEARDQLCKEQAELISKLNLNEKE